ncbi:MAG: diguanylate cyclase [Synergistales bacterium]|nr:diguanylate cyclase [Synergistales bacterium]
MNRNNIPPLVIPDEPLVSLLLDQIGDQMKVLGTDLSVIKVNQATRDNFPSLEEPVGRKCYEVFQDREFPCDGCPSLAAIREGTMARKVIFSGKTSRWMEVSAYPLFGEGPSPIAVIEMVKDITEEKLADLELERQKKRYYQLFNESSDPMFVNLIDDQEKMAKFVEVNDRGCDLLGYSREKLLEKTPLEVMGIGDPTEAFLRFRELIEKGSVFWETEFLSGQGERKAVELNCRLIDMDGQEAALSVVRDISSRKEIEKALMESERSYFSLFHNDHAAMLLIDPDSGLISDANPAACQYYGYPMEKLLSMKIQEINTLEEGQIFEEMNLAKQEKRKHFFFRHRLSSGEIRDVEVYSGPIERGSRRYLYSIIHDITERRKAEEESRRLNEELLLISRVDELTGVFNRRYFEEMLISELDKAKRYQTSLSLIMFDLDHFKEINDSLGHMAGDRVLKKIAHAVRAAIRSSDILARWGGDEFMILTPVRIPCALKLAEKLRVKVEGLECGVSASFGVVEFCMEDTVEDLMKRADKALYNAKQKGRNSLGKCSFILQ